MKIFPFLIVLVLSASFIACQKQQTEEERRVEVERQVQERLAGERQQQQAQELAQREANLSAREQALKKKETAPTPEPTLAAENVPTPVEAANEGESSYSTFYTKLEPYGDWIDTDDYGYVYHPREAENHRWRPYTEGRWVYTEAGWTWVSDEPFGWATYHYGRWTRLRGIGWIWVPGNEWAPAWVSWRKGGQYVGWAPLPPEAHFDRASGIHNWSDNYYDVGPDQYCFVPTTEFGEQRIERAIVPEQQNVTIVNQTTNVTNITYNNTVIVNQGPSYDELRVQSRVPIQRLKLQRETVVPADNAHAVVRGEVVTIPAPVIAPARVQERPRAVKQTIRQATVDRGWSAISDQREADQTRAKMKSEATPPPNAPSKKIVKPASAPTRPVGPGATASASVAPAARVISAQPAKRPETQTPPRPLATTHPGLTPLPANTASPTAPPPSPSATETLPIRNYPKRPPVRPVPPDSATISPSPSAASQPLESAPPPPATSAAPRPGAPVEQRRGEKAKQLPRKTRPSETTPSPSATAR